MAPASRAERQRVIDLIDEWSSADTLHARENAAVPHLRDATKAFRSAKGMLENRDDAAIERLSKVEAAKRRARK